MEESKSFVLNPVNFFSLSCECRWLEFGVGFPPFSTHALPSTEELTGEQVFAKVSMGWNAEGLAFAVKVPGLFNAPSFPDIFLGDSVELFIDTRDLKTAGYNHKFCHHFYFLAEAIEGQVAGEITRFRTEDAHPLCSPQLLKCEKMIVSRASQMNIFIPSQCLFGYVPGEIDRLGFTYRINRVRDRPQHFSVLTEEYQIDQQPALWASVKLRLLK